MNKLASLQRAPHRPNFSYNIESDFRGCQRNDRQSKQRENPWRAQFKRLGCKTLVKSFRYKHEAKAQSDEWDRNFRLSELPSGIEGLKKVTVEAIVRRYLAEVVPNKGSCESEAAQLNKFLTRSICKLTLAEVTRSKEHVYAYIAERKKDTWNGKPITVRTIRRELNTLSHVFSTASEKWGYSTLKNPFENAGPRCDA